MEPIAVSGVQAKAMPGPTIGEGFQRLYGELRAIAGYHLRQERPDHTLQATALVHEAYLRLASQSETGGLSRTRILALASEMIRRILVDYARQRKAVSRGRERPHVQLDCIDIPELDDQPLDVIDFDAALKDLAAANPRQARVVELRYFGGLSVAETAKTLHVSEGTVKGDWRGESLAPSATLQVRAQESGLPRPSCRDP